MRIGLPLQTVPRRRRRKADPQVVRVRLVGCRGVVGNQLTDVFPGVQLFALKQVNVVINKAYFGRFCRGLG